MRSDFLSPWRTETYFRRVHRSVQTVCVDSDRTANRVDGEHVWFRKVRNLFDDGVSKNCVIRFGIVCVGGDDRHELKTWNVTGDRSLRSG